MQRRNILHSVGLVGRICAVGGDVGAVAGGELEREALAVAQMQMQNLIHDPRVIQETRIGVRIRDLYQNHVY